ncbi:MAG: 2-dehydro-3-deoxyphosphogluconate aldolase [Hespellia sp.]|nr:2-dehydro-3-deoxyphosphogluconate aldolase [Hespellia sp.]
MNTIVDFIKKERLIAVLRGISSERIEAVLEALYEGGIVLAEITFNPADEEASKDTLRCIEKGSRYFGAKMRIGAGTVLTVQQVTDAYYAGAEYIISPNVDDDVIRKTKELKMASLPGVLTPSEAVAAWNAGADIVKLFPAGRMGASYLKDMKSSLKQLEIFAVGGVDLTNMKEFARMGAAGFGIGSNLISPDMNFDAIRKNAEQYVDQIKEIWR